MSVEDRKEGQGSASDRAITEALVSELVRLRKRRKIGQTPIAESLGITQARLSQIENLRTGVSLEIVMNYARAIGANVVLVSEKHAKGE